MEDLKFMREAYREAVAAFEAGEYPVGALVVRNGEVIGTGRNTSAAEHDPTAHAEIRAIRSACARLKDLKLRHCTLYTTLYPCPMCEATIIEAGLPKVVFGGRSFSWIREVKFARGIPEMVGPTLEEECRGLFEKRLLENGRTDILDYRP